jgi:hypothetical protein
MQLYIFTFYEGRKPEGDQDQLKHVVDKVKKGKVHPCTGSEALYRPYGP